jgi:hypothetical protein
MLDAALGRWFDGRDPCLSHHHTSTGAFAVGITLYPVVPPKVVAIAQDTYLTPTYPIADPDLPAPAPTPKYGQDSTFAVGRVAPAGYDAGKTPADLKPRMEDLLGIFAAGDGTGMARRLFTRFFSKLSKVEYFIDKDLDAAADAHDNVRYFCNAALNAPASASAPPPVVGKSYIHQALKAADWDLNKLTTATGLGVPAFNKGDKYFETGDFNNGLGLMINGVQYVYVLALHYGYDKDNKQYCIHLKYLFYDVFGLDDDDLQEFGITNAKAIAARAGTTTSRFIPIVGPLASPATDLADRKITAALGIVAWWQLQHQHGYAPLLTRASVERTFVKPAV